MPLTYVFTSAVNDGTSTISKSVTLTDGTDTRIDQRITGSTTNQTVNCVAQSALLKGIYMVSDQNVTIKTNTTTGVDTFALEAGIPFSWTIEDPVVAIGDILTANITGLYATVPGAVTATLQARFVSDPIP